MDLHIILVIACVFLASLISLLVIHKFFRGKTFEEVAAEKRMLAEKLYGTKSKRTGSSSKRSNVNQNTTKPTKRKNSNPKTSSNPGTTTNKSEPIVVEEDSDAESLSTVEDNYSKEITEVVKRNLKEEALESSKIQKAQPKESKKTKQAKKDASATTVKDSIEKVETPSHEVSSGHSKEAKQPDEKLAKQVDSPKVQNKQNKPKKKPEVSTPPIPSKKDYPIPTVNSVMSILGRAEFTRGEIQILIDYLLNKQQDTTANHSEWSDDIVQKLRKKLEEKEKAIEEEQATSAGIQAKLRELRTTINTERVQHNAAIKGYIDEIQALKTELQNGTQDMNDRMEKLKEQYNMLKMQSEHFNPQLLLSQINNLNQFKDNAKRNAFVNQILEILQPQNDELLQLKNENMTLRNDILLLSNQNKSLMINFNDAENKLICQQKENDDEKANTQIQIKNLQAALDSAKSEMMVIQTNSQNHVHSLNSQIDELNMQLGVAKNKYVDQVSEINELRTVMNNYKATIQEKDQKLADYEANIRNLVNKEDLLMKQLQEQKEKNNQPVPPITNSSSHEDRLRELLQRLFPDAVASSAGSALSLSFDQWIEQVISTHINEIVKKHQAELSKHSEQQLKQQVELNNVVNKSPNDHYNTSSNHNESINNHKVHSNNGNSNDVILENAQLRAQVAELKSVVINTENTLKNLELQAQEQESKWRTVVKLKQDELDMLKTLNRPDV
ncbi:ribosome-binding protein 1 isoform X3 [Hermetia illucens]|uniref:ribosome-binding protein 1 isoform X3 n=1 Tax=Hermetia illucens TaxID=343691 RepID=UPI0018CC274D|nr:ribosome-binding protein 1 isoform X3 [Hermetia illucens]